MTRPKKMPRRSRKPIQTPPSPSFLLAFATILLQAAIADDVKGDNVDELRQVAVAALGVAAIFGQEFGKLTMPEIMRVVWMATENDSVVIAKDRAQFVSTLRSKRGRK